MAYHALVSAPFIFFETVNIHEAWYSIYDMPLEISPCSYLLIPFMNNTNMAVVRTCDVIVTLKPLRLGLTL
jgi:hypothetical protein